MDRSTPDEEVESHRHAILPNSHKYKLVRSVYEFDHDSNQNTITLTLVHPVTHDRRCLRFDGAISDHPLRESYGIYILDTSYRQWDRDARIEVGECLEDRGVYFLARSVAEIDSDDQ